MAHPYDVFKQSMWSSVTGAGPRWTSTCTGGTFTFLSKRPCNLSVGQSQRSEWTLELSQNKWDPPEEAWVLILRTPSVKAWAENEKSFPIVFSLVIPGGYDNGYLTFPKGPHPLKTVPLHKSCYFALYLATVGVAPFLYTREGGSAVHMGCPIMAPWCWLCMSSCDNTMCSVRVIM
jgi:hypothetical protein